MESEIRKKLILEGVITPDRSGEIFGPFNRPYLTPRLVEEYKERLKRTGLLVQKGRGRAIQIGSSNKKIQTVAQRGQYHPTRVRQVVN